MLVFIQILLLYLSYVPNHDITSCNDYFILDLFIKKENIKKLLGPKLLGVYDYFIRPQSKTIWGGAFNGQKFRRQIFAELMFSFQVFFL